MRTLLALSLAFVPLIQAQDPRLLKSVEPNYDKYSQDLAENFEIANVWVTLAIQADGKPSALSSSDVPLPMAVVMALKDYEFQPQGEIPHGQSAIGTFAYNVTLNVLVRRTKQLSTARRITSGISRGLLVKQVKSAYPETVRRARVQGIINLEAVITTQGQIEGLKTSNGPFLLIEAAYDSVTQWRYKPYLLNGEPVEVVTTIQVNFALD